MKRTTLILNPDCIADLKVIAARNKITLSALVDQCLREGIARRKSRNLKTKDFSLSSFKLGIPRVNLADKDQLEDLMSDH